MEGTCISADDSSIPEHIVTEKGATEKIAPIGTIDETPPNLLEKIKFDIVRAIKTSPILIAIVEKLKKITGDEKITKQSICTPMMMVICQFFDEKLNNENWKMGETEESDETRRKEMLEKELLTHLEMTLALLNENHRTSSTQDSRSDENNGGDSGSRNSLNAEDIEAIEYTEWARAFYKVIAERIVAPKIAAAATRAANAINIAGKTREPDDYVKIRIIPPSDPRSSEKREPSEIYGTPPTIIGIANETPTTLLETIMINLRHGVHHVFDAVRHPHSLHFRTKFKI